MDYKTAVQAALNGEEDGFAYLYETTYTKMYHKALYYVKNKSDAEDVLQDSYIKAERSLSTLEEPDKFPSWFSEIVVNTSKNYLKKKNRKPITFFGLLNDSQDKDFDGSEIRDEDNMFQPEEAYSEKEISIIFRDMIDSLSDEQRVCILMHHFDEQTVTEIADTISCSVGTVKSRLFYGRKALRKKIEDMQKEGYKFYGAAPISILKYFMEKDSMTSEFLQTANESMKKSELAVLTKTDSAANLTTISAFKNTVIQKVLACCAAAFIVGGGAVAALEISDFNGFAELLNVKNEVIENNNSIETKSNKDTDTSQFNDNIIFDTDTNFDIKNIVDMKDIKDTKAPDDNVRSISDNYSDTESNAAVKPANSVSEPQEESSQTTVSNKPTESPQAATVTEVITEIPQSTEYSYQSSGNQNPAEDTSSAIVVDEEKNKAAFIYESYSGVLDSLAELETDENKYEYYLADMNNDGIIELITITYSGAFESRDESSYRLTYILEVYTCVKNDLEYEFHKLEGSYKDSSISFDVSDLSYSDEYFYLITGKSREEYQFSSSDAWNIENYIGTWQYDDNLYFIFDEQIVTKLNINGDKFEGWYYSYNDYFDDITMFEHHNLYKLSDRTPLLELNK